MRALCELTAYELMCFYICCAVGILCLAVIVINVLMAVFVELHERFKCKSLRKLVDIYI